jgi:hypothetical protein
MQVLELENHSLNETKQAAERAEMHLRAVEDQYPDHAQFDTGYIKGKHQTSVHPTQMER